MFATIASAVPFVLASTAVVQAGPSFSWTDFFPATKEETPFSRARGCASVLSDEQMIAAEASFHNLKVPPPSDLAKSSDPIKIYFNVIYKNETLEGGFVPEEQITEQISVLNTAYESVGLAFKLESTTYTQNEIWFESAAPTTEEQTEMKKALRQGDQSDLNIYTVGFASTAGLLGYATFPSEYKSNPEDDGVVVFYASLPGGTATPFDLGHTLTHETGHWAGLYHTFQGGCSGEGDSVDDTEPEASPASGCPAKRDTCEGGEVDPIHNFMDYSDDACLNEFTSGQATRIRAQLRTYRGINV